MIHSGCIFHLRYFFIYEEFCQLQCGRIGNNVWVEMEVDEYGVLPFVWAAARLTQHQQTGALGHQSCKGDR